MPAPSLYDPTSIAGRASDRQMHMMSIGELINLQKSAKDFVLVDARPRDQYLAAHIPGAVSVPLSDIPVYARDLDKGRMIVTYCGNYHCPISTKAADEFRSLGFSNVWDYKGGITEWQQQGNPTASGL